MRIETINKLCCPFDKGNLNLTVITKDVTDNIVEGFFVCNDCKRLYPIVKGIPIMSPDEFREFKLERPLIERWKKHLKGQTFENFRLTEPTQIEN
tara:strand:- start:1315 stop:1599 length:285 start_codon:yes stop_codon:yes gene_type:complete